MEQILLAYGLSKETVTVIMMLYKDIKVMVHLMDGNTDLFNIVTRVMLFLLIFILILIFPFLLIIFPGDILPISINLIKENSFTLKKSTSK